MITKQRAYWWCHMLNFPGIWTEAPARLEGSKTPIGLSLLSGSLTYFGSSCVSLLREGKGLKDILTNLHRIIYTGGSP